MYPTSPYLQKYKSLVEGADQQVYQRIFYDGERIAHHKRSRKAGAYTTIGTHMPSAHQAYNDWNPDSFARRAGGIGSYAESYIRRLISRSEEHTSELQSRCYFVFCIILEKKNKLFTY